MRNLTGLMLIKKINFLTLFSQKKRKDGWLNNK
jgi:hypothetical protein